MRICVRNLLFNYASQPLVNSSTLFDNFSADMDSGEGPLVILGPSGSGKTTLLKLLGGLLRPQTGHIYFFGDETPEEATEGAAGPPETAFMFQEPRLLPWLTVLENVSLPLGKIFGREEGRARARYFLSLVSLEEKENSYPEELSGGQAQRVSMARAFAWPAQALFVDEPFQSLDIPLRINLMENCLSLLKEEERLFIAVTHDPREAVYLGGRIIVLGRPMADEHAPGSDRAEVPLSIVFDRKLDPGSGDRFYGSTAGGELERELIRVLRC